MLNSSQIASLPGLSFSLGVRGGPGDKATHDLTARGSFDPPKRVLERGSEMLRWTRSMYIFYPALAKDHIPVFLTPQLQYGI